MGKAARSCHTHLFPETKGRLPRSGRALHSWEKLQGGELEREPLCWLFVALVVEALGKRRPEMGVAAWAQADTLMREQDVEGLRWVDVVVSRPESPTAVPEVVLDFSPLERGSTTKGGPSQGVDILDVSPRRWFARGKREHDPRARVFPFALATYRHHFSQVMAQYGIQTLGNAHILRHSGAVQLLQLGHQPIGDEVHTLPEVSVAKKVKQRWSYPRVQGRGRWLHERSLHHYSKPHLRLKNLARMTPEQQAQARGLLMKGFSFL